MSVQAYTVGRDVAVDIVAPTGPLRFAVRTGFMSRPIYDEREVARFDGVYDNLIMPKCWEGSFDYERQGNEVDAYFAQIEADFFAGKDIKSISITETITEKDGSVSQYRYVNVALKLDDAGSKNGTETVKQKVGWKASRRLRAA